MTNAPPVLAIEHVTKDYRKGKRANDDITLHVEAGEVFGLLGHNGAGKTTLLNQVIGIAKPTSGTIHIDGQDAVASPTMARLACSMQPQTQAPLDGVTPREAIELMARIRGADRARAKRRTDELIEALDIGEWQDAKGERLSGGVQRLTAFAMAATEPGRLVMFDEPTNDVDPVRRRLLWAQVRNLADQGRAVLLVTHNVVEAERAVDRLAILDNGTVIDQGTPTQLRGDHTNQLRFEIVGISNAAAAQLAERFTGAGPAVVTGRRAMVPIMADDCPAALRWAQEEQRAGQVDEFAFTPVSLEDIYIRLVGPEGSGTTEEVSNESLVA